MVKQVLWGAALVPFALAVVFHLRGPVAQSAVSAADRPALAFEQYLVDLGEIPPRNNVAGRFGFRNASDRTVTITDLIPSCGCLQPRLDKKVFEPGETGEFYVRVQPANERPGAKEYHVDVRYTDPQPREVRVVFRVTLPDRQVQVRPPGVMFYQLSGEPTTKTVEVFDHRQEPLTILDVKSSSELVAAEIGETIRDESAGATRYQILLTAAGDCPPGRKHLLVTIHTDDATFSDLRVPVLIEGPKPTSRAPRAADLRGSP